MSITALLIMDGFGVRAETHGNAIALAGTPNLCALAKEYPYVTIGAAGMDVGLPEGQMGNSEVGHLNIGAGRVVYQELTRITKAISDGEFQVNPALTGAMDKARASGTKLHLLGLIGDGGVHSHIGHLFALIDMAKARGLDQCYIHCFMDGRDVPPTSGLGYIEQLEAFLNERGFGRIASVSGRYFAMDRDKRWDRVNKAYDALVCGRGERRPSAQEAMRLSYDAGVTDEFMLPTVIENGGVPVATIGEGDSVVFFNFRPDRTRELTRSLIEPDFADFPREGGYHPVNFVSINQYDATFTNLEVAFRPQTLLNTLGEYMASKGLKQLRAAETEKYAHVTFFFNGGVEAPNEGEDRALIPSPKVATYDLMPEMSAPGVADEAVKRIESGEYDLMILNFANCDMVGHTGILEAAEAAVKTVDQCMGRVVDAVLAAGGRCVITADHGNADIMIDPETGGPFTAHTLSPVPAIIVDPKLKGAKLRQDGRLADLAPTLLDMMGIAKPAEMTGESLIIR